MNDETLFPKEPEQEPKAAQMVVSRTNAAGHPELLTILSPTKVRLLRCILQMDEVTAVDVVEEWGFTEDDREEFDSLLDMAELLEAEEAQ